MSDYISRFEQLPNELIIDLLKYFHAKELFHTFYNLNYRLNQLVQSIDYLSLTITRENLDQIEYFGICLPYLHTLIINNVINFNLGLLTNLRRLILVNPISSIVEELNDDELENLEYLSISFVSSSFGMPYLYKKIFSNGFPNLKSYYNLGYEPFWRIEKWKGSPNIRILKFGEMRAFIFRQILSACPNLYYLDFQMDFSLESSWKAEQHLNLKHLILRTSNSTWPKEENLYIFEDLFACIPNLEKLSIHRRVSVSKIDHSFFESDCLSLILSSFSPLLQRFYCYLHLVHLHNAQIQNKCQLRNILNEIIENFPNMHKNHYQAKLIIGRKESPYSVCLDDLY